MKKITLNEEVTRIQEMMGITHVSPSGKVTNMSPEDDDYEINYGKNGAASLEELSPSNIVHSMREGETDENTEVLNKFKDQYGKEKGKEVYYATANKQDRDPETFEKNEAFDPSDSDGEGLSDCCDAPIIMHDICSACGEHCEAQDEVDESIIGGWDLAMEGTMVGSENRVDYLENALKHVWNMGKGNNTIDLKSMAQSLVNDMFGEPEEKPDYKMPGYDDTMDALGDLKLESLDELQKELEEEEGSWMAMRAGKDGKVFEGRGFQQETYFDTQAGALESAEEYAKHKGFMVNWESITPEHVSYESTVQYQVELLKDGEPVRKMLQISLYRMPSGKYELTNYIN